MKKFVVGMLLIFIAGCAVILLRSFLDFKSLSETPENHVDDNVDVVRVLPYEKQPKFTPKMCAAFYDLEHTSCNLMDSCNTARHFYDDCNFYWLDGDSDGIPCESLCL